MISTNSTIDYTRGMPGDADLAKFIHVLTGGRGLLPQERIS
ncbi:MAG: hypothetical protein ACTSUE_25690 [Promethearchaeota archaeon]